jgi:hypothetical protein
MTQDVDTTREAGTPRICFQCAHCDFAKCYRFPKKIDPVTGHNFGYVECRDERTAAPRSWVARLLSGPPADKCGPEGIYFVQRKDQPAGPTQ